MMHRFLPHLLLGLALALPPTPRAQALPIGVTTFADDLAPNGNCTLREAIQAANTDTAVDACPPGSGADSIVLAAGTYTLSLAGTSDDLNQSGDLDIRSALTLRGVDKNTTAIDASALGDRIADILPGAQLSVYGLAFTYGGSASTPNLDGGAIRSAGSLQLMGADIAHNAAGRNGGAIFGAAGAITLTDTLVRDNSAGSPGQSGGSGGGIYSSAGTLRIVRSIVNNNSSYNGYGGGIRSAAPLDITDSWIHDNSTNTRGGGMYSSASATITGTVFDTNTAGHDGGNIYNDGEATSAQLDLRSSELRHGRARNGGGIYSDGALALSSVSLAQNSAGQGGALFSAALSGTLLLQNVTLAQNSHSANAAGAAITNIGAPITLANSLIGTNGSQASCAGALVSAGHNLDAGASCGLGAPSDLANTDPQLGPLPVVAHTPTTFPLAPGSPAINASDNAACAARDIYGRARPHGPACDIGAYETNSAPATTAESYTMAEDRALHIGAPGVLRNDTDPDNDALVAERVDWPTQGTLVLNADGSFSYTPPANFYGGDQFAYRASDGALAGEPMVVHISVAPVNDPPTAQPDQASTRRSTALAFPTATLLANDSDIDGDGLFISAVSGRSAHGGMVALSGSTVRYTPPLGWHGRDSFSYTASDGHGGSASATVAVDVYVAWLFLPVARR